jgi:hypothetical protein
MPEYQLVMPREKSVSDASKLISHEKFTSHVHYFLDNTPQYIADSHHEELQAHDRTDKSNVSTRRQIKIGNVHSFMLAGLKSIQPA